MNTGVCNIDDITITPIMESLKLQKIDDSVYFSKEFNGYISNSRLSLLNPEQDNDPKAFFEGLSKHNKYSDALVFGSAVHELVLQPDLFELSYTVNRPTAKLGFMADDLYELYLNDLIDSESVVEASNRIGYYKDKMNPDRIKYVIDSCTSYWEDRDQYERHEKKSDKTTIYLDSKSRERVLSCVNAVENNKAMQGILHPKGLLSAPISENEQAILMDVLISVPKYDPFIFKIKAKLDNYVVDTETNSIVVNDLKTIGKVVSEFNNNFMKFHYHRELALYSWLMSLIARKYYNMPNCRVMSNCLVVSTIPNYYTKIYTLNKSDFTRGWNEFKFLLRLAAQYYCMGYRFS